MKIKSRATQSLILLALPLCLQSTDCTATSAGLQPIETQAIQLLDTDLSQIGNSSRGPRDDLKSFQFNSTAGLRAIEELIFKRAEEYSSKPLPNRDSRKILRTYLTQLFWNRVAAADLSLERKKALADLRPWLEDFIQKPNLLTFEAKLALTIYPDWNLSENNDLALQELRAVVPGLFRKYFDLDTDKNYPLRSRLLSNLITKKLEIFESQNRPLFQADAEKLAQPNHLRDRLRFLEDLSHGVSIEAATQILQKSVMKRKLMPDLTSKKPLTDTPVSFPTMHWDYHWSASLGRCYDDANQLEGTNLENFEIAKGCSLNDGPPGKFNLGIKELQTTTCRHSPTQAHDENGEAPCFKAALLSYAVGGHRNSSGFLSLGGGNEDETTRISYQAIGTATIPACNNPALCSPYLLLTYTHSAIDPKTSNSTSSIGATDSIIIESKTLNHGILTLTPDHPQLIDRSEFPVTIKIDLSRNLTHLGANESPLPLEHGAILTVENWGQDVKELYVQRHIKSPRQEELDTLAALISKTQRLYEEWLLNPQDQFSTIAQLMTRGLKNTPSNMENILPKNAIRLLALDAILSETGLGMKAQDRMLLEQARQSITQEALQKDLPILHSLYRDRKVLLSLLPIRALTTEIARLMSTAVDQDFTLDPTLTLLQPLLDLAASQDADPLIKNLQGAFQATQSSERNLLQSISNLHEIRNDLNELRLQLEQQLVIYAKQISDLESFQ